MRETLQSRYDLHPGVDSVPDLVHEGTLLSRRMCQIKKNTSAQE